MTRKNWITLAGSEHLVTILRNQGNFVGIKQSCNKQKMENLLPNTKLYTWDLLCTYCVYFSKKFK